MDHLFVYGTLAPGEINFHIMDGMDGTWQRASVRGKRVKIGWGIHMGHPGLFPDPSGQKVEGFIFSSDDLPENWQRLDAFEGSDYERVLIEATLESGEKMNVYIYTVVPKI